MRAPIRRDSGTPWQHLSFLHKGKPKPYSHAKCIQEFTWNEEAFQYDIRGFWNVVGGIKKMMPNLYTAVIIIMILPLFFFILERLCSPQFRVLVFLRPAGALAGVYPTGWRNGSVVGLPFPPCPPSGLIVCSYVRSFFCTKAKLLMNVCYLPRCLFLIYLDG